MRYRLAPDFDSTMDNIAHTLVGAALGQAGLKRRTGLGMATLMIGANLPDVDVVAIAFGESLPFRRGWTHGPLAWLALPFVLTAVVVGLDRLQSRLGRQPEDRPPVRPRQVLLLAFIGVLSHPFFDWLNNYGIRLLMPFSEEWFYGDALFIVDPWLWLVLGLGIFLSRRRERRHRTAPSRPARIALGAVFAYVGLMILGSRWASRAAVEEITALGRGPVERLMAGPVPANPFERQLVFDTGEAYGSGRIGWTPSLEVSLDPEAIPKGNTHPAVERAREAEEIRDFLYWSRFPFFHVADLPQGYRVRVWDARYGEGGPFGVEVVVPGR